MEGEGVAMAIGITIVTCDVGVPPLFMKNMYSTRQKNVSNIVQYNTVRSLKSHKNETATARTILRKQRLPFRSVSFRFVPA